MKWSMGRVALTVAVVVVVLLSAGCPTQVATVSTPTFSPATGTYTTDQQVTISCETAGATIYYTTDGSEPTDSSAEYSSPVAMTGSAAGAATRRLKAFAVVPGMIDSGVASATYVIDYAAAAAPQFDPSGGTYTSDQSVTISCETEGATIFYTTDGSEPTASSTEYIDAFTVNGSTEESVTTTVKAIAVAPGKSDSSVTSDRYTIRYPLVSTPAFDPPAGGHFGQQSVTITVTVPEASIRYTTDGSDPTPTQGSVYGGAPIVLDADATLKAIGYGSGLRTSAIGTAEYILYMDNPGDLDSTFGTDGTVSTAFGTGDDTGYSVAVQSDGKIVVAGDTWNGANSDFAVARYNSDGTPDTSFSGDGKVTTAFGSGEDYGTAIAIDGSGKIVVAGYSHNGLNSDFAVARYNTDGTLDTSFSVDGKVTTAIGSDDDMGWAVAVDSVDRIVVAGYSWDGSNWDFAVARYNTDGTLDTDFSVDGILTTDFDFGSSFGSAVAIDGSGNIVVAGDAWNGSSYDFALARYLSDGSLDTSFHSDGRVLTPVGSSNDYGNAVAIQGDGKIVMAGWSYSAATSDDFAVIRYNTDGTLDTGFGGDGKVTTDFESTSDAAWAVAIDGDGKIVVAGVTTHNSWWDVALVRYTTDGALDTGFRSSGTVRTPIGSGDTEGLGVAIQSDTKIVVAGYSDNGTDYDFTVARYLP